MKKKSSTEESHAGKLLNIHCSHQVWVFITNWVAAVKPWHPWLIYAKWSLNLRLHGAFLVTDKSTALLSWMCMVQWLYRSMQWRWEFSFTSRSP